MKLWNRILTKPAAIFGTGAVLAGAVVAVTLFSRASGPIRPLGPLPLSPAKATLEAVPADGLAAYEAEMTALVQRVSQAVVHIKTSPNGMTGGGEGSGFVIRPDGWIVTNDHVVGDNETVTVVLGDGREVQGRVTRANDPTADVAVVKVDGQDLPALPLGDSDAVVAGQVAIAVGSPFGLENSVSVGHISATGRVGQIPDMQLGSQRSYTNLIQTDASINPGNSGGPLVNVRGEVIGVNTSIYSATGGSMGIGFAIPAEQVRVIADKLIDEGKVQRSFMGVLPANLKPYEQVEIGLSAGAIVREAPTDGPAYSAGIREGDVIVRIGDRVIENELDLRLAMYEVEAGATVPVTYVRDGNQRTVDVRVSTPVQSEVAPVPPVQINPDALPRMPEGWRERLPELGPWVNPEDSPRTNRPRLGVMVEDLSPEVARQYNLPEGTTGVVVTSVNPGTVAERFGLEPGDIITKIGDREIKNAQDMVAAMAEANWGERLLLEFVRPREGGVVVQRIEITLR